MSQENVRNFWNAVQQNPELKAEFSKMLTEYLNTLDHKVAGLANMSGFDFSIEDLRAVRQESANELPDEDLKQASGGMSTNIGEAPGEAMALLYQTLSHSIALAFEGTTGTQQVNRQ